MTQPLHKDDPARSVTMPDGRVVSNLSPADYDATYAEGEPHKVPEDVLAAATARAKEKYPDES